MRGAHDHDMVQAFTSDRADEPFGIRVLPGRPWGSGMVADPHRVQTLFERRAIDGVPIADKVFRRIVPGESLGDLTRDRVCTENYIRAY